MEQLTSGRNLSTEQMAHIQNIGPLELRGILAYIEVQPYPSYSAEILMINSLAGVGGGRDSAPAEHLGTDGSLHSLLTYMVLCVLISSP